MSNDFTARALALRTKAQLASSASGEGSALVTFAAVGAAAAPRPVESKLRDLVSLKDFGAVGDGVANDTAAVQAWANHCAINHQHGLAPAGTYRLTATISVPISSGFTLRGAGPDATIFTMVTNNTPIFDLGTPGEPYARYFDFGGFTLTYTTIQPATNTNALPVKFSAMWFQSQFTDIRFLRGFYAMTVASGVNVPWGCWWNNLFLEREMTGGFIDHQFSAAGGVPNNVYGRLAADGLNCTKPLFNVFKCYNAHWGSFEVFWLRSPIFNFAAASQLSIGALKAEFVDLTGVTNWLTQFNCPSLIYCPTCVLEIGNLNISGNPTKLNPGQVGYLFSGDPRRLRIDFIKIDASQASANFYVLGTNLNASVSIGDYYRNHTGFSAPWQYSSGTTGALSFQIDRDNNRRISLDKGDADYTMAQGDPCLVQWETALTAPRTMNLPNTNNDLFNGYRVRVTSMGAINGANSLTIKAGTTTIATLSADNAWVEMAWRSNGFGGGIAWRKIASGVV